MAAMITRLTALLAAFFVTACAEKSRSVPPPAPLLPPLDSFASTPCRDPGINREPKIAVVEHRRALADCERRRQLAADSYDLLRDEFGLRQ